MNTVKCVPLSIIGTLVDDTLDCGSTKFMEKEESKSKSFGMKPRTTTFPFKFVGLEISRTDYILSTNQQACIQTFNRNSERSVNDIEYSHMLEKLGYFANGTKPDLYFDFVYVSQKRGKKRPE